MFMGIKRNVDIKNMTNERWESGDYLYVEKGYFTILWNEWFSMIKWWRDRRMKEMGNDVRSDLRDYFVRVVNFYFYVWLFESILSDNFKYSMVDGFITNVQKNGRIEDVKVVGLDKGFGDWECNLIDWLIETSEDWYSV